MFITGFRRFTPDHCETPPRRPAIAGLISARHCLLPMTMPPVMPAAIITRATVVGIGRTVGPSIPVAVVCRNISAVVGRCVSTIVTGGVTVIVCRCITSIVAIARAVPVGVRRKATDKGTGNQSARKARTKAALLFAGLGRPGPSPTLLAIWWLAPSPCLRTLRHRRWSAA